MYDAAELQRRAKRCFRFAREASDRDVAEKFAALGRDYMQKAAALDRARAAVRALPQPCARPPCERPAGPASPAAAADADGPPGDAGDAVAAED